MRTIRVFVSSPGDAAHERRRVERVVERLNGTFADRVRLETVRWETGFYAAHATFQAQIPEAADCHIVVAVFRARLGTALPADFRPMADGEPYPSGTAYEVLSAIEARKSRDLPDVFVFRHPFPPSVTLDDPEGEAVVRAQWTRLKSFFERWFVTPDGQFKAAFQTYEDVDRFEEQVDALLRGWLEEHVLGAGTVAWPIAVKGSPFRGLEAFGAKHTAVFFGRERDTERAVDALKDAASSPERLPFLLLIGPSGSGKSSLARAGLLPRLTASGVVPEVDIWRSVVMRPSEVAGGAFLSLATRLFDDTADIPEAESGRPKALPELREGDHASPRELADLLKHADASALQPILRALDRVAAQEQTASGSTRPAHARLLLVVDQLDELLGGEADADARERFGRLLGLLAGTGRVWVVATLRADLYELYSASPELLALKKRGAAYDVEPPGPAALEEIVRRPAAAAGLAFDERILPDGKRQRLDERLISDAERPDMLPLVQFTLNRLYEARESSANGMPTLSHAAYDRLGGLDGAIAQEAERALAGLGEVERDHLPRLLRHLAAGADGEAAKTAAKLELRSAAYDEAAYDGPAKALVDALIAARILLADGDASAASRQVRLAHQRVLEGWPQARAIVAANTRFFRIKPEVERAEARWLSNGKPASLLLPRGVALSEAEEIARDFGDEIDESTRAYIQSSGRRARWALRLAVAAAAVFAVLAVGAGSAAYWADQAEQRATAERDTAERNFALAKQTIDAAIFEFVQAFKNTDGIKGAVLQRVLTSTRQALDRLAHAAPEDDELESSRAALLDEFAQLLLKAGDRAAALAAFDEALTIARALVQRDPENAVWQRGVSSSLNRVGDMRAATGDRAGALSAFDEALTIARSLVKRDPDNAVWQRAVYMSLDRVGDMRAAAGDGAGALAAYEESLTIARTLTRRDPDNTQWQRDVSLGLSKVGDLRAAMGDRTGALATHEEGLTIARTLTRRDPNNTEWQRDVSVSLTKVGDLKAAAGDRAGALATYEEVLTNARTLAQRDPDNTEWQRDVSVGLVRAGDMRVAVGDRAGALAAYEESLALRRALARRDLDNSLWQRDVSASLIRVGDLGAAAGDRVGALAAYEESLTIARTLARRDPDNILWQSDVSVSLDRVGDLRAAAGDRAGALAAYEESLAIRRSLVRLDLDKTRSQRGVSVSLSRIGDMRAAAGDRAGALAAYEESLAVARSLVRLDPNNSQGQRDVSVGLEKVGDMHAAAGNQTGALASYEESLAIRRSLVRLDPDNTQGQRDVSVSLGRIGDMQAAAGNRTGALASYEESLAIRRSLVRLDRNNTQGQRDVSFSLSRIGDMHAATGNQTGALAAYEESMAITRTLLRSDPNNTAWQRELLHRLESGLDGIGNLKAMIGDKAGAQVAYQESFTFRRMLTQMSPPDSDSQIATAELHHERAYNLQQRGQLDIAAEDYESAFEIGMALAASTLEDRQKNQVADVLGSASFFFLFVLRDQRALEAADIALTLAPDKRFIRGNRAYALMFLGRASEAREAFLDPSDRGKPIFPGSSEPVWEEATRTDFKELREAGRNHPLMDEIESEFSKSPR